MSWQDYKVKNINIEGARAAFEKDCARLFTKIYPALNVQRIEVSQGDEGIDILVGNIDYEPIKVIQCKFFLDTFGDVQKGQIRKSFNRAITSNNLSNWILCIPRVFTADDAKWWAGWCEKMKVQHSLNSDFFELKNGDHLIGLFKDHGLYDEIFSNETALALKDFGKKIDTVTHLRQLSIEDASNLVKQASLYLEQIHAYFGDNATTHIERTETETIYNWIVNDLQENEKGVFILEGDKGYGKTVILKDLLTKLGIENIDVLGIKADIYYASDRIELEKKIFQRSEISIDEVIKVYKESGKRFIILIDQIDALSQSLSSNREYIQTYTRLISDFSIFSNVRIIISSRSYDLNYDANLRALKSFNTLKVGPIEKGKVKEVLYKYDVNNLSESLLNFLAIPNHLDIFCKLPDKKKLNFNELDSLEKLFGALWRQLVTDQQDFELKEVLYLIVDKMSSMNQITVRNIFDNYPTEINYLKSNNLVTENNSELQFFHQTFYDYIFSRQFVEEKKSLLEYIDINSQSLYARSVIKMVIDYYRDFDHKEYVRIIAQVIKKSKYRFHLKNLVITTLGTIENPTEIEKKIVTEQIFPNLKYTEVFIGSIFSREWLKFLIIENIPLNYLTVKPTWQNRIYDFLVLKKIMKPTKGTQFNYTIQKELKYWIILRLFLINANNGLDILIKYFDGLPNFEGKANFMERFLMHVNHWENEKLLELFEIYFPYNKDENSNGNFWFYQILQKIFITYSSFVFKTIRPIIIDVFDEQYYMIKFSHEQETILKKMFEHNPDDTFAFVLSIFDEIVEGHKNTYYFEISDCPFYNTKFSDIFESEPDENADELIQKILLDYLKIKVRTDREFFIKFYNNYKNSDAVSHIKLLILALSEIPFAYRNEILELIEIIHLKKGLNILDNGLPYFVRDFIAKSFAYFDQADKNKLVDIILSVRYYGEDKCHTPQDGGRKYHHLSLFGERQHQFILALPKDEVERDARLRKLALEHGRKFGNTILEKQRSRRIVMASYVGTPLPERAYKKMKLHDWKKSILFYDDDKERRGHLRGGKYEHANKFQDIVASNPNYFYSFIESLIDEKIVSIDYLSSGIAGLINAKYEPLLVKKLYLKFINFDFDVRHTLNAIRYSSYLIDAKVLNVEIVNYLSHLALTHPDPEKDRDNDLLLHSRSSVRGAAVEKIISCYVSPEFKDAIFATIEKACFDKQATVKISILLSIAFLNHLDPVRAFKSFLKLVDTDDIEILKASFGAAQYYRYNYHNQMNSYYDKIIFNEELHQEGSILIVQNWVYDYDMNDIAYKKIVSKSKTAKLSALRVAEKNIYEKNVLNRKCLNIFFEFLNDDSDDFARVYSGFALRKFASPKFNELLPFFKKYCKSELFKQDPRYFLQFLIKNTREYPSECLQLLSKMDFSIVPFIQKRGHYDTEPVELVLLIYNTLNNSGAKRKEINKALSIFDDMLQIEHLRLASNKAMDTLKQ